MGNTTNAFKDFSKLMDKHMERLETKEKLDEVLKFLYQVERW